MKSVFYVLVSLIAALLELLWLAPAAVGQTASINGTFTGVYTQQNPANPVNGSAYADFLWAT